MDTAIAIYGAALATLIAIGQGLAAVRHRARVGVSVGFTFTALDESNRESAHGTPLQFDRGGESSWEEALLRLTIRNEGGVPIQVVAVVIESLKQDGELNISQFAPEPLPHVLEPGTRIEITMQKEPIDMLDNVAFFGVTDALGRRYAPKVEEVRGAVRQSWDLPTRVRKYSRRDDPAAPPILAYQNRERESLISTARTSKKAVALVRRQTASPRNSTPPPA